jgi:hypothetical protein
MSNLDSVADLLAGMPPNGKSGLVVNYPQKTGESPEIIEGDFIVIENASGEPVFTKMTSDTIQDTDLALNLPDQAWLALEGMDQTDSEASDTVTAVKISSGIIYKVATGVAFSVGDLVRASAGKPAALTSGVTATGVAGVNASNAEQPVGQVLEYSATGGYIIAAGC